MKKQQRFLLKPGIIICLLVLTLVMVQVYRGELNTIAGSAESQTAYHSPFDLTYSPDGKYLAVSNSTAASLDIIDTVKSSVAWRVPLNGQPRGLAWHENRIFVAEYGAGTTALVDANTHQVVKRYNTGKYPVDVAVAGNKLLVTDLNNAQLLIIDLDTEAESVLDIPANPCFIAVCPQKQYALVGQSVPEEMDPESLAAAAAVTVVDLESSQLVTAIKLPHGSSNVRQIQISNDGRWAYVAHTLGKTNLPLTHITKGWVATNAITVIDLDQLERHVTFLLDRISEGAANPWGLAISGDGQTLWVSISGVHQVLKLDMEHLHWLITGEGPSFRDNDARRMVYRSKAHLDRPYSDVWFKIKDDPANLELLQNDLGALWGAGIMTKIQLPGYGPRGIALSPDNSRIAVGAYYSGEVFIIDSETNAVIQTIALGEQAPETFIRRGERLFHDATLSQQGWLSCATCHPGGGADGLRWDLPDGRFGDPVSTKPLNNAYQNYGEDLRSNIRGAYWVEMIAQPKDEDVEAIFHYIVSLAD
ncbi:MAG TPA: hypothetical protein GX739_07140 [Firmicutes bacterium]|nr:hypothetical protein [Bacillota bacterium]